MAAKNSLNYRGSAYTPFLRRFTDERAHDLAETRALYSRVTAAHRTTVWAAPDAIERFSNFIADQVTNVVELPAYVPFGEALDKFQRELLALETVIFSAPAADLSRPLTLQEQVDLNRFLRAQEYLLAHQDRISERLVLAIGNVSAGLIQSLPPLSDGGFVVPLISLLPNPHDVVDSIIGTICTPELADVGLFTVVQDQIYENMCAFSGVPLDGSSTKPLIKASEADLSPEELVDSYLAKTPFHLLFFTPVPFALPDEQRFAGHWIIAPSGRGKTTLLHSLFLDDLKRDASIIVMDSKGDLINPIKELAAVKDRLLLIEPDADFAFALNPLDVSHSSVMQAVTLIEYIMAGLLDAKFTALQSTLFRNVVPAIIEAIPHPTFETFKTVMVKGLPPDVLPRLNPHAQHFFADRETGFYSKTYESTRKEVVWRLDYLMTNPVLRSMFSAVQTKLDIGKEMDAGKVIVINNSKAILTDEGAEFFGRFFIALIVRAAQQRAGRRMQDKKPCYVYIDECQAVIAKDARVPILLDECRSQKIALILSHQRTAQLSAPVLDAVANCAIRMANSDDEAKYLSDKLRMHTDTLRSLPRGTFAAFVRDYTSTGLALKVPHTDLSALPKMTAEEQRVIRERMRQQFSFSPNEIPPPSAPVAAQPPASPSPAASTPPRAPSAANPTATIHTHDPGEPASKWGDR
jgi:hypothetical protein